MRSIFKRRFLGILGFGLFFILIDSVSPSKVEACHGSFITKNKTWAQHSAFEKLKCKAGWAIDDINPVNYFKKKEKCQARADNADTVAIGKRWYKDCMKNPGNY